jgi:hypothetical protein
MKKFFDQIVEYWDILFSSAAENQIKMQKGQGHGHRVFRSYSQLKKFQKKLRRFSFVLMLIAAGMLVSQILYPSAVRSKAAISIKQGDIIISDVSKDGATVVFKTVDEAHFNRPLATVATISVYQDPGLTKLVKTTDPDDYAVTHIIKLEGLENNREYYLRLNATDSPNDWGISAAAQASFSANIAELSKLRVATAGQLAKIYDISDPFLVYPQKNVMIMFKTDQEAKCHLRFNDEALQLLAGQEGEMDYFKDHTLKFPNSIGDGGSDYRIKCEDRRDKSAELESQIINYDFASLNDKAMLGANGTSDAKISNLKVEQGIGGGIAITWDTDQKTNSIVQYRNLENDTEIIIGDVNHFVQKHSVSMGMAYAFYPKVKVISFDLMGRKTEIEQDLSDYFSQKNSEIKKDAVDENKLILRNISDESSLYSNEKVQAIVSWYSNKPADTKVIYKEGKGGEEKEVSFGNKLSTEHMAVFTQFKTGTVYYFKVKSTDESGQIAFSEEFSLLTPSGKEGIIRIIKNNIKQLVRQIIPAK